MALKIRCTECRKRISIDEAFAGGMCRCPYCKATVYVPDKSAAAEAQGRPGAAEIRPAAPGGRPAAPVQRAAAPGAGAAVPGQAAGGGEGEQYVPMARPVKVQGIITIILLALLLLMVGGGVTVALLLVERDGPNGGPPDYVPPNGSVIDVQDEPAVADVKITSGPVLYCVDGGSSMRGAFDAAAVTIQNSIVSLGQKYKLNVLRCGEEEDALLAAEWVGGGESGKQAATAFFGTYQPRGATNIARALTAALGRKPGVIVLIARKPIENGEEVAAKAKKQGVPIITIVIDGDQEAIDSMFKLSDLTGGGKRSFTSGEL